MTAPDPARLACIHAAAFRHARPWSAAEFAALIADPHGRLFDRDAAFALWRLVAGEAELLTIATAPQAQRRGHARALMAEALARLAAEGVTRAFLEVAADNAPALALYTGCGFTPAGRRRGYYQRTDGPAADAVVMTRPLR